MSDPPSFAAKVKRWQRAAGRHGLPWQGTRDPYRVWLSEVMLQQTQVSTVIGYYERFLERFPDVQTLAAASQDEVLSMWSGLGYYSRARNLHRCAQMVVSLHAGEFPPSSAALARLPGIGRSTAAAIAAFCHGEQVAILDGNVKRVLTRVLGFAEDTAQAAAMRRLWERAQALLPAQGIEVYTQGLMDLGATVCLQRRPLCEQCPLQGDCWARQQGRQAEFPVKSRKLRRGRRSHAVLLLCEGSRVLLVQRPAQGVWAGLWSLPEFDDVADLEALVDGWPGQGQWLPTLHHALTHFDWALRALHWQLPATTEPTQAAGSFKPASSAALQEGRWLELATALSLGLPAPVRRWLEDLKSRP